MKNQISFSTLGNECVHKFRNKINNAENIIDLKNQFVFTVINFLNKVFEKNQIDIDADDIKFDPEKKDLYILNKRLTQNPDFKNIWENSDLKNVLSKFAESAHHRYIHICKHKEKTNKKIRQP